VNSRATALACSAVPSSLNATGSSTSTIFINVVDNNGYLLTYATNTVTVSITGAQNAATWLDGTSLPKNVSAVNGIATVQIKSTTQSGNAIIVAVSVGLVGSSVTVTVMSVIPTKIISTVNPNIMIANGITVSTVTATLVDNQNNPINTTAYPVMFDISGQGTWLDGSVGARFITPAGGVATISLRSTVTAGTIKINVNSYGLIGSTNTVTMIHGPAYKLHRK
jgi:adhesin/invasin